MYNDLIQKNAELGRFLFCERYTLQPVKNALYIAEGQDLKRGAVVDVNGVLVGTNSLMPYAVLETDCDTRAKGAFASVFVKGEFNFDKLFFADGLSKDDIDNIVYNGSGAGLVFKPYDYEAGFSPSMVPAGTSEENPIMNAEDVERMINAMKPIDVMTLRFEFSKKDYNPETAGVGSAGTWIKVVSPTLNVWDWTNENTDWHESFMGAFTDEANEVRVIAAGDTSNVTKANKMFAGIFNGNPSTGWLLTSTNNVVECVSFDLSNCTSVDMMFCASNLRHANFDLSNISISLFGFYAATQLTKVPSINLSHTTSIASMFARCIALVNVGILTISENLTNCTALFMNDSKLEYFGGFLGDLSHVNIYHSAFALCQSLKSIGTPLDMTGCSGQNACVQTFANCYKLVDILIKNFTSAITSMRAMFGGCREIPNIPIGLNTSGISNFTSAFANMREIESIEDINVDSATNVNSMFLKCYNVKYGIIAMYNKLLARGSAITDHTDTFLDCGINTEEGRAERALIPKSWGGDAEG